MWQVNAEDKRIAEKLELSDRIDVTAKREAFITLKDHKENFRNKPTCRLINPCKPELGKVSKQIVEKIVHNITTKTNTNQWKNTNDVINWFNAIKDKSNYTMICFEHIWKLKENNTDHTVTWKILEKAQPYTPTTGKCNLCTTEKAYIAYTHPSLNKRRELFSTCPHRRKHLLSNLKVKSEEKKASSGNAPSRSAPSGSAPRPPEEDGRKCPAATGL